MAGWARRRKKREKRNEGLAYLQTKGAMRLMRAYGEISSRTTKYALVVLAESLRNKERSSSNAGKSQRGRPPYA